MPTCSFREMNRVLKALGFVDENSKKGTLWTGISLKGDPIIISIHDKAGSRDIADGTLDQYIKDLGFKNYSEFNKYLKSI